MQTIGYSLPSLLATLLGWSPQVLANGQLGPAMDRFNKIVAGIESFSPVEAQRDDQSAKFSDQDLLDLLDPESGKYQRLKTALDKKILSNAKMTVHPYVGLFSGDEAIGSIHAIWTRSDAEEEDREVWEIMMIDVSASSRGKGVGQILMDLLDLVSKKLCGKGLAETGTRWHLAEDNAKAWKLAESKRKVEQSKSIWQYFMPNWNSPSSSAPASDLFWATPSGKHLKKLGAIPEKFRVRRLETGGVSVFVHPAN